MIEIISILLLPLSVAAVATLTIMYHVLRRLPSKETKKQFNRLGRLFFYRHLHIRFFSVHEIDSIFFIIITSQSIYRFLYASTSAYILLTLGLSIHPIWLIIAFLIALLAIMFFGELIPRMFAARHPRVSLKISAPVASIFMILASPLTFLLLKLFRLTTHPIFTEQGIGPQSKLIQEVIEVIQEADIDANLDLVDKELIESVVEFSNRIAREVMVPRIDIFALSAKMSVREAAIQLKKEGFSRVPVYQNTIDNIVGILMYKDVLHRYMEFVDHPNRSALLEEPIESIIKKPLFTPETKKISHLLQDFKKHKLHLAIVVDEYGGTEGIVTIEDILEEIVGEIADEYDTEAGLCTLQANGSWIIDAKINILDLEEETGIQIPEEGDYDTLGGYIYHRTGTIPSKGFVIDHDNFILVILKSGERGVEKVRISPKHHVEE